MSGTFGGVGGLLAGGQRRNPATKYADERDSRRRRVGLTAKMGRVAFSLLLLVALDGLFSARAQTKAGTYSMAIGSGFLCESGEPGDCTATSTSLNGDSYELNGAGTFDSQTKSAHAAGTFRHKSTNAGALEWGVWIASELISFESYGVVPHATGSEARRRGPKRLALQSPMLPIGGLAILKVRLMALSGASKTAVLQVNCALGNIPRDHSVTGIRIKIDGSDSEYVEDGNARVVIIGFGPEVSSRVPKTPAAQP